MTWDGAAATLNTTAEGGNEYHIPSGYEEVTASLSHLNLSVFMDGQELKEMLTSEIGRTQAVQQIVGEVSKTYSQIGRNPYEGVTIDFEACAHRRRKRFWFLAAITAGTSKTG